MLEGRTIQQRLPKRPPSRDAQQLARSFANLMFVGNTKAALRLITEQNKGEVLRLDDLVNTPNSSPQKVRDILESKHPSAQPPHPDSVIPTEVPPPIHPIVFDALDTATIRTAALHTNGAAGPSGLDAHCWRRLCSSFSGASNELCHSLAKVAIRICTSFVDPRCTSPLLACRLIAINKNPGVHPIGICQTARRIIAKAVLSIVGGDVLEAAGSCQLCAGQPSGTEAAVHAVRLAFHNDETDAVLLVDASNAFNALNRQSALHNIRRICPSLATILINTYRNPSELFVDGNTIWSQEGTTQGDPLAMPMYALATIPLIQKLSSDVLYRCCMRTMPPLRGSCHPYANGGIGSPPKAQHSAILPMHPRRGSSPKNITCLRLNPVSLALALTSPMKADHTLEQQLALKSIQNPLYRAK